MAIKKGDKVKIDYKGTLDDGSVFDTSEGKQPVEFEVGTGQVIKGFETAVEGMAKGDSKQIKLKPEEAYGQPDPKLVQKVPKDKLPEEAKPGMMLMVTLPQGQQIPAKIKEMDDKEAVIDLNHPLSGKNLNFDIKVVDC